MRRLSLKAPDETARERLIGVILALVIAFIVTVIFGP